MKRTLLFWGLLAVCEVFAQVLPEKGMPLMQTFTPAHYGNNGKIWGIQAAPNGMVYMAADGGLLAFDGQEWRGYKGSKGFTRSIWVASDSVIFTGSDLDFGVWNQTGFQDFSYTSLYPFQGEVTAAGEEFWGVFPVKNGVVFRSSQNLYLYKNGQLVKTAAPSRFTGGFAVGDSLYFTDQKNGLFLLEDFELKSVAPLPEEMDIAGLYRDATGLVLVSRDQGLFRLENGNLQAWGSALSEKLKAAKVFCFAQIGSGLLAFGTVLKGAYLTDASGNTIHHLNRLKGLPNNTILSLHSGTSGSLWLGTDYGLAACNIRHDVTLFYDYGGNYGTGAAAMLKEDKFYLGTNQGLHLVPWEALDNSREFFSFQLVPGTDGQVWSLAGVDGELLVGHDKGLFAINGQSVRKISEQDGVWTILPYKDYLLTGNYNGISIFRKEGNNWIFLKKMELILGSCNQLLLESDDVLWVNIPNFGVIRCVLGPALNPVERRIFPEEDFEGSHKGLVKNDTGLHLFTSTHAYTYQPESGTFAGKAHAPGPLPLEGLLPGVYQPSPLKAGYAFYPVHNGFALQYTAHLPAPKAQGLGLVFRKVEAFNNEGQQTLSPGATLPWPLNNLRAAFTVPNQAGVLYQYQLTGPWSNWSKDNQLELVGLREGSYTLSVRASLGGETVGTLTFPFYIAPPWYRTWPAYLAYALMSVLLFLVSERRKKASLKRQRQALLRKEQKSLQKQAEKHQQQLLLLEQEKLQAGYEQLKQQLKTKTVELAQKAKENEDKNRLLAALKEKIAAVQEQPALAKKKLREMERLLEAYLQADDRTFEIQMDELHQEFFRKLKARFPGLSSNDLRLCAYLKIGLNSKEIAEMLNIQPSSFYISRSRLRKKLGLETEENLYDFLNGL
jgi:hypothetical protein